MGQTLSSSGGAFSTPVYADDGVTVVGTIKGGEPVDSKLPPQRWFDGPGPQMPCVPPPAPTVKRVEPSRHDNYAMAEPSDGPLQLFVRNLAGRPLTVSCGAATEFVPAGRLVALRAGATSVRVSEAEPSGILLCELAGVPSAPPGRGVGVVVLVRQVGDVICASFDYQQLGPSSRVASSSCAQGEAENVLVLDDENINEADYVIVQENKEPNGEMRTLEEKLNEAMQRGDMAEMQAIVKALAKFDRAV